VIARQADRVLAFHRGERFASFPIPARRLLRRGEFTSRQDLIDQIREFTLAYDDEARPFRWTYDGTPLKAA